MNRGLRIIDPQYFVAAVAVVALGRIGVAKRADLAMECVFVGLEFSTWQLPQFDETVSLKALPEVLLMACAV